MHRTFEVDVILSGAMEHILDGVAVRSEPGDVVIIPAWEPHRWTSPILGTTSIVIQFLPDFLGEESIGGFSWIELFARPPAERPRATKAQVRTRVLGVSEQLRREIEERPLGWVDGLRLRLLELLLELVRGWNPPRTSAPSPRYSPGNLQRIMPALALSYAEPSRRVSLIDAAQACKLSTRHFANLFRDTMGLSFGRFATRVRVNRAARLLHTTDMTVETVAERTGFVDHSHLRRVFLKMFGVAPAEFRELRFYSRSEPGDS
jgi:AraC-like DNA-binding protein